MGRHRHHRMTPPTGSSDIACAIGQVEELLSTESSPEVGPAPPPMESPDAQQTSKLRADAPAFQPAVPFPPAGVAPAFGMNPLSLPTGPVLATPPPAGPPGYPGLGPLLPGHPASASVAGLFGGLAKVGEPVPDALKELWGAPCPPPALPPPAGVAALAPAMMGLCSRSPALGVEDLEASLKSTTAESSFVSTRRQLLLIRAGLGGMARPKGLKIWAAMMETASSGYPPAHAGWHQEEPAPPALQQPKKAPPALQQPKKADAGQFLLKLVKGKAESAADSAGKTPAGSERDAALLRMVQGGHDSTSGAGAGSAAAVGAGAGGAGAGGAAAAAWSSSGTSWWDYKDGQSQWQRKSQWAPSLEVAASPSQKSKPGSATTVASASTPSRGEIRMAAAAARQMEKNGKEKGSAEAGTPEGRRTAQRKSGALAGSA